MTGLDRGKASVFFKDDCSAGCGGKMTKLSGIEGIIPGHVICDFEFDPCGYSMNGMENSALSTVHVTPEEGFSYASYEAMGFDPESIRFGPLVHRVLRCFGPADFSVAVTCKAGEQGWATWDADMEGYLCENAVMKELPGGGCIVFQTYSKKKRGAQQKMQLRSCVRRWRWRRGRWRRLLTSSLLSPYAEATSCIV